MPLESYAEPEVAVTAAVIGIAASPSLRKVVRRSMIYGLAGVLVAYDRTSGAVHGVVKGVRSGVKSIAPEGGSATAETGAPPPVQPPVT